MPYCLLWNGGAGLVLGGYTEDMVEQYIFLCFMVSISGGVGRFVPIIKLVEKGDATGVLGLFQILVSIPLHCIWHQLGENDS
jgi:hypothetical protein